jgi:cytochrome c peroxidase
MKKLLAVLPVLAIVVSCNSNSKVEDVPAEEVTSELFKKTSSVFVSISSLPESTISREMIVLGKKLYFDNQLSKNNTISCSSCHDLNKYGVDNLPTSLGDTKLNGNRNSPSTIYAFLHGMQFWDGRAKDVEEQAGGPLLNPIEHGIPSEAYLIQKLSKIPEYAKLFKAAFPTEKNPITFKNLTSAIASFERQLSPTSKFDEYLDGNESALNEKEKTGLANFMDNGCITCHSGIAIGGQMMQKFGVYSNYWEATKSKKIDNGLFDRTKIETDKYLFKTPSLRNIEKTYPYFHDGSIQSLKEAIKIMAKIQLNKDLDEEQISSIEAFLKTLTADVSLEYKK